MGHERGGDDHVDHLVRRRAGAELEQPQLLGAIIWALAWRRQDEAVSTARTATAPASTVDRISPFKAIQLVRTPGFKAEARRVSRTGQRR